MSAIGTGSISVLPGAGQVTSTMLAAEVLNKLLPTGVTQDYVGAAAPTGWVMLSGRTIGSAASGATERANADTEALYTLLWDSMTNTEAPVSSGRGASAAADFAANKTITLPDARGRTVVGKDNMGGTAANRITSGGSGITGTTLGASGGAQTHTLVTAETPAHSHTYNGASTGPGSDSSLMRGSNQAYPAMTITSTVGSGNVHNNTQPSLVLNKIIKL